MPVSAGSLRVDTGLEPWRAGALAISHVRLSCRFIVDPLTGKRSNLRACLSYLQESSAWIGNVGDSGCAQHDHAVDGGRGDVSGQWIFHLRVDNARHYHAKRLRSWRARSGCQDTPHLGYCPHLDLIEWLRGLIDISTATDATRRSPNSVMQFWVVALTI
jgi:hypothetical protein